MATRAKEISDLGNTGYLEVDSNGNVGIGTANPRGKFEVSGGSGSTGVQSYFSVQAGYTDPAAGNASHPGGAKLILWDDTNTPQKASIGMSGNADIWFNNAGGQGGAGFTFYTGNGASATPEARLKITKDGNVGIGTTIPNSVSGYRTLHINGTGGSLIDMGASSLESRIVADTNGLGFQVTPGSHTHQNIRWKAGQISGAVDSHMILLANGNVGIGLTNPGFKLDVQGEIASRASSPGLYLYDSNVSNLQHRIIGGGDAGIEYAADMNNVGAGYHRWDIGPDTKMILREDGYMGFGTTSLNSQITLGKITTSKTDGKSIRTYRSYGDATRTNHSRIISYGYNPGYNQYTYHRIVLGGGVYGAGSTVRYKFIATTGHASGHGYVEGIISLRANHSDGKLDSGNRHTVICRHVVGGSYYGWSGWPDVTMFKSNNTDGNAAIIMRCEGHVNANGGTYDGSTNHTIHLEIIGSDHTASQRMEFIGHSAPSDISGAFSRSLLSEIT